MLKSTSALISLLAGLAAAEGTFITSGEFGLSGSFGIPTSDFAGEEQGDGFAQPGAGFGLDFLAHLNAPNLAWSTSASFLWNPTEVDGLPPSVTTGTWINIPILTGVRAHTARIDGKARFYGQIQAGINLASQTDTEGGGESVSVGWAPSLGLSVGAGAILFDRYHVGARFFHLGEPEYDLESTSGGRGTGTQEPRVLALMLGFYFDATN
jgi:hypothetical protein